MSILQALNSYYDRMAARGEAEAPGWSREKFGWCLVIDADGQPVDVLDLHDTAGKKPAVTLRDVPAAVKRTVGIAPNTLWDKTNYVFGRTAGSGKRSAEEHAAFRVATLALIGDSADPGLLALRRFLEIWAPERFDALPFRLDMLDGNFLFRLQGDGQFLHDRPASRALVEAVAGDPTEAAFCLVTGVSASVARLHPTIKGVEGAQSSGAALVSFNLDAFESYGKSQGQNAPTSQAASFRYGAALNRLLDRGSTNRTRIGDATVTFWADTSKGEVAASAAEGMFSRFFTPPPLEDADEAAKLRAALEAVAKGRPMREVNPDLEDGTRFHILGLSPNAARLSIRFWLSDDFSVFAQRLAAHFADLEIAPSPWRGNPPAINQLLVKTTALMEKFENIPPQLAGEVTRAVLEGRAYPQSWLAAAVIRLRAGDDPLTGWHAAAIKAVLCRAERLSRRDPSTPEKGETPVSLDREHPSTAYQLGRLFAVLETAQRMALGKVNASIRDRYFGAASATPAGVFPLLLRGVQNHLGKLRKNGTGGWIEREIEDILDVVGVDLPRALPLAEQGRFAIGYYHQRKTQFAGRPDIAAELADDATNKDGEDL
ncbi:type I-C CRISPR-associated protein Cas8c/Csd1 [Sandarakinorhabdus sp.]|uniref:type I-C CRISPR-associated protein Cas8c/Csd1 n=1 Tax=Sandarakinorhabdus sp. TaxID=1916663 RepID=UPI0033419FBE